MLKPQKQLVAALLMFVMASAGCLVGGSSKIKREGTYVSDTTLREIQPGKTTSSWVLATLGTPTERVPVEPGRELWKYSYKETSDSSGYVFLIFGGHNEKVTDGKVFVEIKDGVVAKTWRG